MWTAEYEWAMYRQGRYRRLSGPQSGRTEDVEKHGESIGVRTAEHPGRVSVNGDAGITNNVQPEVDEEEETPSLNFSMCIAFFVVVTTVRTLLSSQNDSH